MGWNMIGGGSNPVSISAITTNPAGIIDSQIFAFRNGAYVALNPAVDMINPGAGHWVKVNQTGTIILNSSATKMTLSAVPGIVNTRELNKLSISDQSTISTPIDLFFGIPSIPITPAQTYLPPAASDGFDARFLEVGGDKYLQAFASASNVPPYAIRIASTNYPINIKWQIIQNNYSSTLSYNLPGGIKKTVKLAGSGVHTISDSGVSGITLTIAPIITTCFLSGTPITLADGSSKAIEEVKVGDMVLAFDEATKTLKPDKVKEFFVHEADEYLIVNGRLKLTDNHPVNSGGKWVEIGKLKVGDSLLNAQGKQEKIASMQKVSQKVKVYNMEVNPYHTYIAGGIVVHNKPAPDPTSPSLLAD
jgi:hypothetical protein